MQHDAAGVLTAWVNEFNAGNVDVIAGLYSPDATLFGTISPSLTTRSADVTAYFAAVAKSRMQVKLLDAPTVTNIADAAVVLSGLYEFSGPRPDGQSFAMPARYSFVVANINGRWLIAHQHSSPQPKPR
ncbi:MAG: SgcJ/EcaC family oxidoreductase [Rhizobiales bacterium]|nr:SgcJ/EcaC family oxidoreductase [Hyphomicrobiales bacterium]MBN9014733.1 SgcJ/EcaC family oxidoreductase [Hyphomicrobiales bacterium]